MSVFTRRPPAPFIVGVGRSGTTLMRLMLDSHPELCIPAETHIFPDVVTELGLHRDGPRTPSMAKRFVDRITSYERWGDFHIAGNQFRRAVEAMEPFDVSDALRIFYRLCAARYNKSRWGDKTPRYVFDMVLLHNLLPEARFIYLIRDGRDVFASVRDLWFGANSADQARRWVKTMIWARRQAQQLPHYLEVRYEALVRKPVDTLRRVCAFSELPWSETVLNYYRNAAERLSELRRSIRADSGTQGHPRCVVVTAALCVDRGPIEVPPFAFCTWQAIVDGGHTPYGYQWSGVLSGTSNFVSGVVSSSGTLSVLVTSNDGQQKSKSLFITLTSSAPTCVG